MRTTERGMALLAVLFALMLLALLALPFAVSMGVGAEAASREVHRAAVEQASASVRDLLLADAALSDPVFDPTPAHDGSDEWPTGVELPKAFEPLREDGRVLLGGEVWDTQRFFALDGVSPLVLANLLGTAVRLREDLLPEAKAMLLDDTQHLPASGMVWVGGELIRYGQKDDQGLLDLARGLLQDQGFADGAEPIAAGSLVLDYRCIEAAAWPFTQRAHGGGRRPFASVRELAELGRGEVAGFTADELDVLAANLSVDAMAQTAATWGRPERVFDQLQAGKSKSLRVKSALHVGAGSTVRITNQATGLQECALVMAVEQERGTADLPFPVFRLDLLVPVAADYPAVVTVVEPLIPAPVNINTAPVEVLTALLRELRRGASVRVHDADGRQRTAPPPSLSPAVAREVAEEIVARRSGDPSDPGYGPFTGWRDLIERVLRPRLDAASNAQKSLWLTVYRNLETGRDCTLEMGTAPICFESGPWVGYRAAASRARSVVAPGVVGRHERTGTAVAVPGFTLEQSWNTQRAFEEAFRLDRRAPFWTTTPINLGALQPGETGNDPAPRYFPHLVPIAFPGLGLGEPRYANDDPADVGIEPATATTPSSQWAAMRVLATDTFAQSPNPRGHDVKKDGPYRMQNTGPSSVGNAGGGTAGGNAGGGNTGGGRHDRIAFPFAGPNSFVDRFAVSFWVEPQSLEGTTLFDHGDGDPDRNRIALHGRDGNLVFEVTDEAGIDPNPGASPAGVPRTASEWTLPLAELQLPADTPLHLSASAYGNRPNDLAVAVDGMSRGKQKFVTYLTTAIPAFDPTLGNNLDDPPGRTGSERYLGLPVESTEGFPPQGVLRIGTELFEYSGLNGNTFDCVWRDSIGGRGARMWGREFRPSIPVDSNGEPTVDLEQLASTGVNLDVFPSHPVGAQVELYGYSTLLSDDSPMMPGTTRLASSIGGFAVARGWLGSNARPITIATTPPFTIGTGLDETWTGDLELCDPVPTGRQDPQPAATAITDAFPTTGGYALLIQRSLIWQGNFPGTVGNGSSTRAGGVELIRYTSRNGNKLTGVQRAQTLPGDDNQISRDHYEPGRAQRFVTNFEDWPWDPADPQTLWDDIPTLIVWVVPVSLPVQGGDYVWDPAQTGLSEWVQLYPDGGDANDTEWVRYDVLADRQHLVRANRARWDSLRWQLTRTSTRDTVQVGGLGPQTVLSDSKTPPWGTVTATSGFIGYVPQVESDFPQIFAARDALRFRGDPFTRTSSHAHTNSVVMQCQRLQLNPSNWGAFGGRVGRFDRVAIVQGSTASGSVRPPVEWHTVNWSARRFGADNLSTQKPAELLGPWPFQLVAFQDGVQGRFIGPTSGTVPEDPRQYDRVVKFPSGELPAAYCEQVHLGSGVGGQQPITGVVDEVEVVAHEIPDLVVETAFTANANTFDLVPSLTFHAAGPWQPGQNFVDECPTTGGLLQIDGEILAYQARNNGTFTVAANGRGLLNTEARDHDRGARVRFLSHRPVAILNSGVGIRDDALSVTNLGALPRRTGTLLLGRELLHYCWARSSGGAAVLAMPRWFPPGEDANSPQARGLFRGRFGTTPQTGQSGEAVVGFPFRYWDRHASASDDPELAYAQLTTTTAPSFFRTLRWREESRDARVDVVCLVRADGRAPFAADPATTPDLWRFEQPADAATAHRIATQASRLEIRFATVYRPGVLDLVGFTAHGWKTTARVEDVRLEYDGQPRIVDERVTAR
ncbi:MAG: hypothetical protein JNL08_14005 [Planctomycetes bacterium]|nr:hypothetical protein [Planctomycetota bacterium]